MIKIDQIKIHFSCRSLKMSVPGEATNSVASSKYLWVTNETAKGFSLAVGAARANMQLQDNASVIFLHEKIEAAPPHLAHARKTVHFAG